MQIEKISDTYHRITFSDGSIVYLIGTAHVSKNSVEEVRNIIETENPDRICIELDSSRLKTKTDKADWENMDIRKVFKEGRGFFLLANTALASFQKRMGAQTGINPGEEILSAASIAKEKDIPLLKNGTEELEVDEVIVPADGKLCFVVKNSNTDKTAYYIKLYKDCNKNKTNGYE